MWFSVLGTLELENDGDTSLSSNSTRLRTLLAALLCNANRAVGVDRLAEQVWDGEPPQAAARTLQVYVHRLRAVLGADRVIRDYNGYRLVVEPYELDAWVFERMVETAREARLRGDPRAAAAHYRAALDHWRGPYAYQGVGEFAELIAERDRLTELRLATREARIEADLSCGEGAGLVDELIGLVEENPLRERFRAQAMLALQRAGRTEEALRIFREFEKLLIEEHGLEPAPSLRRLAEQISNAEPELQPTVESALPTQLPLDETRVTGRDELLDSIVARLVPAADETTVNPTVVTVSGLGGVGKSTVALRAAHSIAYAYPDGQLYANLLGATPDESPENPLAVLAGFLRALGQPSKLIPATLDEASARFRTLTTNRRILVVLDDAYDVAQVRPLLPGGRSGVLITSRPVLAALDGADTVAVQPLGVERAVDLLSEDIGADRVRAEPEAAAGIARLSGGLPLALRIVGARLVATGQSLASFTEALSAGRDPLSEWDQQDAGVRASFEISYRALSDEAADIFDVLGVLDLPQFTGQLIRAVLDRPEPAARRRLDELVEAQLLRPVQGAHERYDRHDLIRLYAQRKAAEHIDDERRTALVRRMLHSWLSTAGAATTHTGPAMRIDAGQELLGAEPAVRGREFDTADDVVAWIRAEIGNVIPLARRLAELPATDARAVAAFPLLLHGPMHGQSFSVEQIELNLLVLDICGPVLEEREPSAVRRLHRDLIHACLQAGRLDDVLRYAKSEIEACRQHDDRASLASAHQAIGLACTNLSGRQTEAREALERALELHRDSGNRSGETNAMNNLGNLALRNDDLVAAREWLDRAHALCLEHGPESVLATIKGNLGETHLKAGQRPEAVELYTQAIAIGERIGYTRIQIVRSWDLGDLLHEMGDHERARRHWRNALELAVGTGQITRERVEAVMAHPVPPMPRLTFRF